ncbi:TolC family protein [bacterium]|nr:TolC family protein [bacterium]
MKKYFILTLIILAFINSAFAIEDSTTKRKWFNFNKDEVKLEKTKKNKRVEVSEVELPQITPFRKSQQNFMTMSIEECVKYAIEHNPNLAVSLQQIKVAESGIGQQKASFAPRLTARVNYNHLANSGTRIANTHNDSVGFNAGISQLIWDFGKTFARINMAKYDTQSALFDYDYDVLNVVYNVKINYYNILRLLANLDIYEQNVRINTLNYERTKAMFDEGLKSKIDVVNAEVNLTDSKIQLVDAQKSLATNVLALKNSMYYSDDKHFIVQNTENFGFLKADYKKKMQSLDEAKPSTVNLKKNEEGLIMLTSGIEHNDIIQDYQISPLKLTRQEAVDKALENRPDLKSSRMLVKVQEESLKAVIRSYAPDVTADLTWGYTKNESTYTSPFQVGASMGLGSINPVGIHYQIKQGEAYLDIANHNINVAKQDIYWEVQENYINMRQLERKIPLMSQKVKASLENFELADGRYSVGLNNYVELQDALANYNNAQLSFVQAVFEYNVARETLRKSMGILEND